MSCYRVIQMTNSNLGANTIGSNLPFGTITRRVVQNCTFSTDPTTISINECGNYDILYSITGVASAAGIVTITINSNATPAYSVSSTVAAGDTFNLTAPYQVRVLPNCPSMPSNTPLDITVALSGVGITGGSSNIIIERRY